MLYASAEGLLRVTKYRELHFTRPCYALCELTVEIEQYLLSLIVLYPPVSYVSDTYDSIRRQKPYNGNSNSLRDMLETQVSLVAEIIRGLHFLNQDDILYPDTKLAVGIVTRFIRHGHARLERIRVQT